MMKKQCCLQFADIFCRISCPIKDKFLAAWENHLHGQFLPYIILKIINSSELRISYIYSISLSLCFLVALEDKVLLHNLMFWICFYLPTDNS